MSAATMNVAVVAAALLSATASLGVSGAVLTPGTQDQVNTAYVSPLTSWLDGMRSADGWDLGAGLSLHLDTVNQDKATKSLLEQRAVRLDFNGIGMRIGKEIGKDALDLGFYADDGEGRGKNRNSEFLLHALFGFNIAGMFAFTLAAFGALVLKSLVVAKMAFLIAAYMMIKKLFGGGHSGHLMRQNYELMEPHPAEMNPTYIDYNYSPGTYGYPPTGGASSPSGNPYLAYSSYGPTGANSDISADTSNVAYAIADAPAGIAGVSMSTVAQAANLVAGSGAQGQQTPQIQQQQVQRRRDLRKKPHKPQHVILNKYTKIY